MERVSQMEEYIREYRNIRQSEKSGMIEKEYHCLLPSLYTYMDSLIKEQTFRRKSDEQEGIKYILFFRLLSSGYTGSNEIALGMSNSMIYLDDNFSCVYWRPNYVYENIEKDIEEVNMLICYCSQAMSLS